MKYQKLMCVAVALPLLFILFSQEGNCQRGRKKKMTSRKIASLQNGTWGGKHVSLDVTDGGASVEYDCGRGTIDERIVPDSDGRFEVKGTHVMERPGPVRIGREDRGQPARYTGSVNGTSMTLTVTLADTGKSFGTFTLRHGVAPQIVKCL